MRDDYRLNFFTDHDRKIMIFRVIGPMPGEEFVERLFESYATVEAPWSFHRVMDFRRFEGLVDYAFIEEIARRWSALCAGRGVRTKVALLSADPLDKARITAAAPMFPNETILYFTDYQEAMAWIAAPDSAAASA